MDANSKLLSVPSGNPMIMFCTLPGKTGDVNAIVDSECSYACLKYGAVIHQLNGFCTATDGVKVSLQRLMKRRMFVSSFLVPLNLLFSVQRQQAGKPSKSSTWSDGKICHIQRQVHLYSFIQGVCKASSSVLFFCLVSIQYW